MAGLIGVFGGTFDPPHLGHLILGAEACQQLDLDLLLWVLTPDPPHKRGQSISPAGHRLAMLQLALQDNPAFRLSRVDLDRPGPHYAVDSVRLLRAEYPGARLAYLVGGDSLADLPAWHNPAELLAEIDLLGVMRRPGDAVRMDRLAAEIPGLAGKLAWIDAPLLDISSSDIRTRCARRLPFFYLVPPGVHEYIRLHGLYCP